MHKRELNEHTSLFQRNLDGLIANFTVVSNVAGCFKTFLCRISSLECRRWCLYYKMPTYAERQRSLFALFFEIFFSMSIRISHYLPGVHLDIRKEVSKVSLIISILINTVFSRKNAPSVAAGHIAMHVILSIVFIFSSLPVVAAAGSKQSDPQEATGEKIAMGAVAAAMAALSMEYSRQLRETNGENRSAQFVVAPLKNCGVPGDEFTVKCKAKNSKRVMITATHKASGKTAKGVWDTMPTNAE